MEVGQDKNKYSKKAWLLGTILAAAFVVALPLVYVSAAMTSASYKIPSDSVNAGSDDRISSATYKLDFTSGEISSGKATGASYNIHAGYQQMQPGTITLSAPGDVTFSAGLGGVTGGQKEDTAVWTVTTDGDAGYEFYVKSSTDPSMQCVSGGCEVGVDTIADYGPAVGGTPDYDWSVASSDAEFGFTPEGTDLIAKYLDNASSTCNTSSNDTSSRCWHDFDTSNEKVASATTPNHPSGTATTIRLRVESGSSHITPGGTYQATVTATATAL
ncbi:MAG: hypothetical protein HN802_00725 [Candidatus Jacksonbacteria bacterium]|nr:hypothetical protein [Candidatus Jacksonbacteria bacterium]MBT6034816.1 hypothetical protein [Candidatus Jacksonbacteria bacterium]MBT6756869.1 hypothetical protein [Candidatus Jacksonbacteria bacterium]MBT6954865.1 hypothetical protein [Candidatus Jacksonbacteria bacterium]MBT7338213.1 hypothetical protein [Candidatus Jacksonbacteria bacterium]